MTVETREAWFDAQGQPCDPADAVYGEIAELDDDGVEIQRTYVDRSDTTDPDTSVSTNYEAADFDMLKFGTWDLYAVTDGIWTTVTTLDQLFTALGIEGLDIETRRDEIGRFLALPAWTPAPEELKAETYAWLEATRRK